MTTSPELRAKLSQKLGVTARRVYKLIENITLSHHVSSEVATLILATQNGMSPRRYGTPEEMAELRAALRGHPTSTPDVIVQNPPYSHGSKERIVRSTKPPPKKTKNNSIFVVHGRDARLKEDMFNFLRAIGLFPMEWSEAVQGAKGANPNISDIVHGALMKVQGVIVMFSPDEQAKLKPKFAKPKDRRERLHLLEGQARPNVIFEAGLALGAHSKKTLLVEVGEVRKISDIDGMHILHLSNSPESRMELAQRLRTKLKFKVNTAGTSWVTVGDFDR